LSQRRYKVLFTPLIDPILNTYGTEIDVSDRVEISGISSIKRAIDSSDYDIGVFFFSDVTISGYNLNGYFNDQSDSRSIFTVTRDRCKVKIQFIETDITRSDSGRITDATDDTTITFFGLINEEATRADAVTDKITFKVLSRDSVFRTTKIAGGTIANGVTYQSAIFSILNTPKITSILTVTLGNINPALNQTVDDGSAFDNMKVNEALNLILLASNSVMVIDETGAVIIKNRTELDTRPVLNLYGKSDTLGRENIITITTFNTGTHRNFTSVLVNETEFSNTAYVQTFGYRQKKLTLDFMTDASKIEAIGDELVAQFQIPKIEISVRVPTSLVKDYQLLDRVSINYPLRAKPISGKFLPIVGSTKINDSNMPLPDIFGSFAIHRNVAFKILEIDENPRDFTSVLKLRQAGFTFTDGYFNEQPSCIVGFAVVGEGNICAGGTACDTYNPAAVGGAQVGCTEIA